MSANKSITSSQIDRVSSGFLTLSDLDDKLYDAERKKNVIITTAMGELAQFKLLHEHLSDEDFVQQSRIMALHMVRLEEIYEEVKTLRIVFNKQHKLEFMFRIQI